MARIRFVALAGLLICCCQAAIRNIGRLNTPKMDEQRSGVAADLRSVTATSGSCVWASGTGGTWLRTTDGGNAWTSGTVPGAERLDFRSLAAFDERRAIVLSAGSPARMFKTVDGGASWREVYRNDAAEIFFDALRFADESRGYALADPIAGRFVLLETVDGGETWTGLRGPQAKLGEGAFAASNSALAVHGDRLWFGTGGAAARVFRSTDRGRTWEAVDVPAPSGAPSRGVFSLVFAGDLRGALVGGDYQAPDAPGAFATTEDGGITWTAGEPPPGYRSSVVLFGRIRLVATGTSGTDSTEIVGWWRRKPEEPGSSDTNGWGAIGPGMNALSRWADGGWAVGAKGRIAYFHSTMRGP
ncbi:MAG TPA: oxidoreductase [Myxococcales bacterium]|nr:oxidoreductase [Myxococcales bacterium]